MSLIAPVLETSNILAYLATVLALVTSPGPDTMLILRYTLASGKRVGLATVLGVQLGLAAHTAAAVLGLSLLILSSPLLFRAVALAGALYLGWLGIQSLRAGTLVMDMAASQTSAAKALRDAMITNILNPKVIVLFLALMPNFVSIKEGSVPAQLALLALLLTIVNTIWQTGLVLSANAARRWLSEPTVQKRVSWSTGLILLFFAVAMLMEHVF